jgi:ADP-ribosylglycohydrolase
MIAFVYSFYYLKQELTYEKAMRKTLLLGGDTDTNAAIVGGMMGAYHGIDEIQDDWRNAVLNSTYGSEKFLRTQSEDEFLKLVMKLYNCNE